MHAVSQYPRVLRQVFDPFGGFGVLGTLVDMYVNPDPVALGQPGCGRQQLVATGERGVDTDQAPPACAQEPVVFFQAATGVVRTMAVCDSVGRDHPNPDLGDCVGNDRQAALQRSELRRPLEHLEVEGGVESPPDQFQDLLERGGGAWWGWHPPGQRRVQVVVGADQPRSDGPGHPVASG